MDLLEFWIWEHATKYGMTKVLKRIKTCFAQTTLPNSWITAQLLRQVKDEWGKHEKITFKEVTAVHECLTVMFKHDRKGLKRVINVTHFVELHYACKAAFLVLRLKENGNRDVRAPWSWKSHRGELFPEWNDQHWARTKHTYGLKDDDLKETIQKIYLRIKSQLQDENCKNTILDMTGSLIKKYFPLLINYLHKIQPSSVLENIKAKPTQLDPALNFLPALLKQGIRDEINILNLWEELQLRRAKKRAQIMELGPALKQRDPMSKCSIHILPPKLDIESNPTKLFKELYPPCFERHPFMPSCITIRNRDEGTLEEVFINKTLPLNDAYAFVPHWFSDGSLTQTKQERVEEVDLLGECREWSTATKRAGPDNNSSAGVEPGREGNVRLGGSSSPRKRQQETDGSLSRTEEDAEATSNENSPSHALHSATAYSETEESHQSSSSAVLLQELGRTLPSIGHDNDHSNDRRPAGSDSPKCSKRTAMALEESDDDNSTNLSPKKRCISSIEETKEGHRLVPQLLHTLQEQSSQLRLIGKDTLFLDQSLKRVSNFRQTLSTSGVTGDRTRGELVRNICGRLFMSNK